MIYLAGYGWQGESWHNFYPDDLPNEWQLDFYANQFQAVVVPHSNISAISADQLAPQINEWRDQAHAEFRFFVETDDTTNEAVIRNSFGEHWGGIVPCVTTTPNSSQHTTVTETLTPMQQRQLLEKFYNPDLQTQVVVITETKAWQQLQQMRILCDLIGYS